jgi:hypothetical protein
MCVFQAEGRIVLLRDLPIYYYSICYSPGRRHGSFVDIISICTLADLCCLLLSFYLEVEQVSERGQLQVQIKRNSVHNLKGCSKIFHKPIADAAFHCVQIKKPPAIAEGLVPETGFVCLWLSII